MSQQVQLRMTPNMEYVATTIDVKFPCGESRTARVPLLRTAGTGGTARMGSACSGFERGLGVNLEVLEGDKLRVTVGDDVPVEGPIGTPLSAKAKGCSVVVSSAISVAED